MQVAQQSHWDERQEESTESGHLLCVPTLTAARLPDSDLEGRPSGRGLSSLTPSCPGLGAASCLC